MLSAASPYALCAAASLLNTSLILAQVSMLGRGSAGCLSSKAFVIISRSGTSFASLVTQLVCGVGVSQLLIMASSAICLSAIVLRIISMSANRARFQMGTNAVW